MAGDPTPELPLIIPSFLMFRKHPQKRAKRWPPDARSLADAQTSFD
jgi:hypothetical protein